MFLIIYIYIDEFKNLLANITAKEIFSSKNIKIILNLM